MTNTTEQNVGIDPNSELYVIKSGGGVSTWGFDVILSRCERIGIELTARGVTGYENATEGMARGSREVYDTYVNLLDRLKREVERSGERAVFDLTPDLMGLEGHRVEVVDKFGETRRFIVGKSTGWAPCHLEVARRNSTGGGSADKEYESVIDLGKVW